MPKRGRRASEPSIGSVRPRGRPRGKRNELAQLAPVLAGKRPRTSTVKDEELVQAPRLRDKTKEDTEVAYRKRRKTNLRAGEKVRMLARVAEAAMDAESGEVPLPKRKRALEEEAGVGDKRQYVGRSLLKPALDASRGEQPLAFPVENRAPSIFTEDVDAFMAGQALLWDGDFSWAEMAAAVNKEYEYPAGVPSGEGCRKHCLKSGWTDTKQRILPWLSEEHMKRRAVWAALYSKQKWLAWVDVDEKWFYTIKLHGRRKRAPGQKLPPRFCKSKTNIPKVMFLSAVARPRPGFDGKLGIWRVAAPKTAQKKSKNHERGTVYDVDVTMTAERYFELMTTTVFKAIAKGFRGTGVTCVIVQQDGAKPHTGKDVVARMNVIGKTFTPKIEVRTQPAQSPDMNVNDLALFRALDVAVRKSRRGMKKGLFDKEQLVKDVLAAAAAYPTEQLEKMWDYKSYVMEQVKASKGGNDYPRHRA
jgi:hypothetical protein